MAESATLTPPAPLSSMSSSTNQGGVTVPAVAAAPVAPVVPAVVPAAAAAPVVTPAEPVKPAGTLMEQAAAPATELAKTEPAKTEAAPPAADYKVEAPKDTRLPQAQIAQVEAWAKAQGLNQKQAQELVTSRHTELESLYKSKADVTMADPEIGGINIKASMQEAYRGAAAIAPSKEVLAEWMRTPLGNDVTFLKAMINVARMIPTEAKSLPASGAPARQPSSTAEGYYGATYYANGAPIKRS